MSLSVLLAALAGAAAILEGALIVVLLRQHGRTLIEHERVEARLAALQEAIHGLTVAAMQRGNGQAPPPASKPLEQGSKAPGFELSSIDGSQRRLEDLAPRRPLLVFFDPTCGFCQSMAPALGELEDPSRVVLISRGTHASHEELRRRHGWRCEVLLDPTWEVAGAYRTGATPTGYLIDQSGRTAGPLLVGAEALLRAATAQAATQVTDDTVRKKEQAALARARAAGLAVRDVTHSRINRNGLAAGAAAPDFSLPDIHGTIRSSTEYRGTRTLLVFSDPDCEPCQQLVPMLVESHPSERKRLQIVVISRGDPETNRLKAEQQGISFPVLIQNGWAVSRKYGIFVTPVGYLISPAGQIEQPVAIGAEAILQLATA